HRAVSQNKAGCGFALGLTGHGNSSPEAPVIGPNLAIPKVGAGAGQGPILSTGAHFDVAA
ncbi:MAG: hypothetical protein ACI86S_001352, partial [Paracoccaceae bacterium]